MTDYKITDVQIVNVLPIDPNLKARAVETLMARIDAEIAKVFAMPIWAMKDHTFMQTTWPPRQPSLRCPKCDGFVICTCSP